MGQMMALDPTELEELARRSNYPEYGISGRLNYITERGRQYIGVSGNKAQHADLTIELGFSSDLGVTNDRYPLEVAEGQSQMLGSQSLRDTDFDAGYGTRRLLPACAGCSGAPQC